MIANADSIRTPLADGVVQCVVTSPPYWGLRAYSGEQERKWGGAADCEHEWEGEAHKVHIPQHKDTQTRREYLTQPPASWTTREQTIKGSNGIFCQRCGAWRGGLGFEPTPELFIEHLVQVFREVRRVMRPDAVAWVNMGDCYNDKQLAMIPHRLALALQADGWWVRSDVVWAKPNPMPESISGWRWEQCKVKVEAEATRTQGYNNQRPDGQSSPFRDHSGYEMLNAAQYQPCTGCDKCRDNDGLVLRRGSWRPTSSHEYVFMLAKSSTYFSDGEAVRERDGGKPSGNNFIRPHRLTNHHTNAEQWEPGGGRNLRSVWNIATQPFKGAHYATFPTALAQRCVLASTSRHACSECGAPHVRVVERTKHPERDMEAQRNYYKQRTGRNDGHVAGPSGMMDATKTLDYRPSCQCGADVRPCIVLDPFCGSGTVGQVCRELPHRRDFVGLDLSFDYLRDQALIRSEQLTPASKLAELPMFA